MKLVLKIFLTILFIPLFLLLLIAVTIRFQFLAPSFWENTFSKNNAYSKLAVSINKNLVSQTVAEGGKSSDVRIFTDIISSENLKDVIDRNIENILTYANGRAREIIVYVPVNKIPKSLLSSSLTKITEQMSLSDLLKEFNVSGVTPTQLQSVSRVGVVAWIFFGVTIILPALILYCFYLLVSVGKRLVSPGVALILSGTITLVIALLGTIIRTNWTKDLVGSLTLGDSIIGIIAPPVIQEMLKVWLIYAAVAIVLGFVLFFIKKPGYNIGSKSK